MELKMSQSKSCTKCGATWIEGQHYWSGTGALGNEDDLAGLVLTQNVVLKKELHGMID